MAFDIIFPIPYPDEYYIVDNKIVSKEEFHKESFLQEIMNSISVTHVKKMTIKEVIEKFEDVFPKSEIEKLKNFGKESESEEEKSFMTFIKENPYHIPKDFDLEKIKYIIQTPTNATIKP